MGQTEMKQWRFTLRALLLAITAVAMGMWFFRTNFLPLPISESNAKKIMIGQTQSQVSEQLGRPHLVYSAWSPTIWEYDVFGTWYDLYVEFDQEGRVVSVRRNAYITRNPD
jgi:hypothetical protein